MSFSDNTQENTCPCCQSPSIEMFHRQDEIPVNSVVNIQSREKAVRFPKGIMSLGFCADCGFIYNTSFNPDLVKYSTNCEESQGCSQKFNSYLQHTAETLIQKYDLYGKDVLEIGCGKGEFLRLLCSLGNNRGIGFDPAYVEGRDKNHDSNKVTFINDFYSEKYADHHADFICCRMTLEHIRDVAQFVNIVRQSIKDRLNTKVFFQVPDVIRILRDVAFEDIYYEHCSYFSRSALARLFQNCGFNIIDIQTAYDGQYIMMEAEPVADKAENTFSLENDVAETKKLITVFQQKFKKLMTYWGKELQDIKAQGRKAVLWGSGSKAVSFLTTLGVTDQIEFIVDINPHRQGTYMAGTGHRVVAPDYLVQYKPDLVIIMNAIYRDEIEKELKVLNLSPELKELGIQ